MFKTWRAAVCGLGLAALSAGGAAAQDKVSLAVDWVLNGTHAGYFVAQEKGFYKDAGLDVTISRGFGSGDTVKRVATKAVDFGIADTGAIIGARANDDIPVRIVGMIYDRASLGLIYLKDSNIKTPKDLEGKTLARSASGASVNMFPGFLKANSIDRTKISEIVVDGATYLPMLLSGQADAVLEQAINIGKFAREAQKNGKEAVAMRYSDFGLEAYGNALFTQADMIASKPELISRFTEASLRGVAYALEHPEEAIEILHKSNPEIHAEGAADELIALKDIESTDDVEKYGLGYIGKARMEATRDTITQALSLKRTVPAEDIYTDAFLPKTPIHFKR
jgi:NitT/TauT family transport system substrate-binding protein